MCGVRPERSEPHPSKHAEPYPDSRAKDRGMGEMARSETNEFEKCERTQWLRDRLQAAADQIERGEYVEFTVERRSTRMERAIARLKAGELPNPDVCP